MKTPGKSQFVAVPGRSKLFLTYVKPDVHWLSIENPEWNCSKVETRA
jgi:hypothetical protein